MFVRKKKNRSGSTSVVVVNKHGGKFKELHTVGVGRNEDKIFLLCEQGRQCIKNHLGIQEFDFDGPENRDREVEMTQTVEESQSHWLDRPIVPNRITVPITELFV